MVANLADKIALKLYSNNKIEKKEVESIAFAIELIITHIICFCTIFFISFLTESFFKTLIFLLCFIILRKDNTGYHAKTFFQCFILTNATYIICVFIAPRYLNDNIIWILILLIIYDLYIYIKYKRKDRIISIFFALTGLLIFITNIKLTIIIATTLIIVKITDRKTEL